MTILRIHRQKEECIVIPLTFYMDPNTELVNKRWRWLGLPPSQEMKKDEFTITPAYD